MTRKLLSIFLAALLMLTALPVLTLAEETVAFTDSCGREVTLPADITRIAPSGPLAQMALISIAPDLFVGVSTNFNGYAAPYFADYEQLPIIGQLYGGKGTLNLEELAVLDPQVILDVGEAKGTIVEDMDGLQDQLGIPMVHIDCYMDSAPETYRTLGTLLGREEKGEALAACIEHILALGTQVMEDVGDNKVSVAYLPEADSLSAIAKGSYHSEIIDMMADNAVVVESPSSKGTGDPIDMEQMLVWDPQYIIFAPGTMDKMLADDPTWQELTAIQEGNYCEVPMGPYNWLGFSPSVQRYLGILWLGQLFYPDSCEYDLYEEVANYYSLFYGYDLTVEAFDTLTGGVFAK